MKRLLSVLLAVFLVLALAGCGGKSSDPSGDNVGSGDGDVYAEDGYAEGRIGDTMHTYWFNYKVNSAYTCGEFAGRAAAEGSKLLVVEIYIDATQEMVYQSKAIPTGAYIENARLDKVLEPGEYPATAYFKAYREEDHSFIGQAGAAIKITVLS